MNLFKVDFQELYERHLCRHSQFGNNVIHLASVVVSYLALFSLASRVIDSPWGLLALPVPYFVLLAFNVPMRLLLVCLGFVAFFFAFFYALPPLPIWLALVLMVVSHKVQVWSHLLYPDERDMSAYAQKYRKGPALFVLLSLYELPILLNYMTLSLSSAFARGRLAGLSHHSKSAPLPD
jgi:hypothetical protein